jgi:DNA-binding response OmpR family regulator
LLDHEDDGRSFIAHTLRDEGYAVYQVSNESELVRALDDDRYDAAIVDVDRLIMTLAELTTRIARRTTLVRLMSNVEADPTAGASPTLRKPFLIKDLKAVVESAVADRRRGPRRGGMQGAREAT